MSIEANRWQHSQTALHAAGGGRIVEAEYFDPAGANRLRDRHARVGLAGESDRESGAGRGVELVVEEGRHGIAPLEDARGRELAWVHEWNRRWDYGRGVAGAGGVQAGLRVAA